MLVTPYLIKVAIACHLFLPDYSSRFRSNCVLLLRVCQNEMINGKTISTD